MSPLTVSEQPVRRIRRLDPGVVNKIAAGEVIERPASVLKELLDNSLDAGATRIDVEIVAGGTELIRVVDNGGGIHPDDLVLSVSSHATSKICSADDLFQVRTYGFRGEALASIAEVSRLLIRSRTRDAEHGTELTVDAGRIEQPIPSGCPEGTTIEIRDLFCSTPVRRKFMKSHGTEFSHIVEQFTRAALAQPGVHMTLTHNSRSVYELPATTQLLERLRTFYGDELAEQLIPVQSVNEGVRLSGYVGHPSISKATRKGQHLFLNGRWIQDRSLQHAVQEAYRGLLMVGRQPITFLYLDLDPESVDVNVHPTKIEVRFREGQALYRQILSTIRRQFLSMNLESQFHLSQRDEGRAASPRSAGGSSGLTFSPYAPAPSSTAAPRQMQDDHANDAGRAPYRPPAPFVRDESNIQSSTHAHAGGEHERPSANPVQSPRDLQHELTNWAHDALHQARRSTSGPWSTELVKSLAPQIGDPPTDTADGSGKPREGEPTESTRDERPAFSHATPEGLDSALETLWHPHQLPPAERQAIQILDCYLAVETEAGLTLFDQHALHERIIYETLRPRVLAGTVESQRLLVPLPIEMSPASAALLIDHREVLSQLGFGIEDFGRNTVLVSRYPVMLARSDWQQIIKDLADHLAEASREPTRRDLIDHLLHRMSCRAAIKAGQKLTPEEIESLLEQRHFVDDAHHCPHGRPTALVLTREILDRQFGRLG